MLCVHYLVHVIPRADFFYVLKHKNNAIMLLVDVITITISNPFPNGEKDGLCAMPLSIKSRLTRKKSGEDESLFRYTLH